MADGTGPHLYGVLGRDVAAVDGFNYSSAMQEYAETVDGWGYENMFNFLENPRRYMPGTAMSFAGLRDQEDRINLIAYMHEQGSSDMPFPEPLATPAEEAPMAEGDVNEEADAEAVAGDDAVEPVMVDEETGDEAPIVDETDMDAEPQPENGEDQ